MSSKTVERLVHNVKYLCYANSRPMIWGEPGVGKSEMMEGIARSMGRRLVVVIGSYVDPTTMGFPVLDTSTRIQDVDGRSRPVVDTAPMKLFTDLNDGPPWLLFLDELSCVPGSVRAAWLRLIDKGYAGDYRLDMRRGSIVAAGNPAHQAVNGTPLEDPMVSRLAHLRFPVTESAALEWASGSFVEYWGAKDLGWPKDMRTCGVEDDHIIRARSMFSEYIRRFPTSWHPAVTDSKFTYGDGEHGWPCARSLDRASRSLAIALAEGRAPVTCLDLIEAEIGSDAAIQFQQYVTTADIPDPESVLANPSAWKFSGRVDLDYAVMLSVAAAVATKPSAERLIAGFTVCARSTADRDGAPAKEAAMAAVFKLGRLIGAKSETMKKVTSGMTKSEIEKFSAEMMKVIAPFSKYVSMVRGE